MNEFLYSLEIYINSLLKNIAKDSLEFIFIFSSINQKVIHSLVYIFNVWLRLMLKYLCSLTLITGTESIKLSKFTLPAITLYNTTVFTFMHKKQNKWRTVKNRIQFKVRTEFDLFYFKSELNSGISNGFIIFLCSHTLQVWLKYLPKNAIEWLRNRFLSSDRHLTPFL